MVPTQDKAHATCKEAQELVNMIDCQSKDSTPETPGKRAEDSGWRTHEERTGHFYEPERSYVGKPPKKQASDAAASGRDFRERWEEPTHDRGGLSAKRKELEEKSGEQICEWERDRKQAETGDDETFFC